MCRYAIPYGVWMVGTVINESMKKVVLENNDVRFN